MNKKNTYKKLIIIITSIVLIIYFICLIVGVSKKSDQITKLEAKVLKLKRNIRKERKNKKIIEKLSDDFLENAYFDRKEKYFENYIRGLFNKYRIKLNIYQSKMDKKNYSELDVNFTANAFDFFKLIKDIEEGNKIIVIKNLSIKKNKIPYFKVTMRLGGFYKE